MGKTFLPKNRPEFVELGELCQKISVGLAISVTPYMREKGTKLIRNQNIKPNYFDSSSLVYIDDEFAKSQNSKRVQFGDVISVRTGSNIGDTCIVPDYFDGALTFTTLIARPNKQLLNSNYLSQYMNSSLGRSEVNRLMAGGGKGNLNSGELKRYLVLLLPIVEQRKIAEILGTWDSAIAKTEKLIIAKQKRKKALVQSFFTHGKQVTSSNCVYQSFQFKDIVENYIDYRGRTPLKISMQWGGGEIKALSANNVQMGFINLDKECYLGSEELYKKWMVNGDCEPGDILLTTEAPLGNVAQIPDEEKYILSQRVILIKPKVSIIHKEYLFQFMMSDFFQTELQRNSSGSTAVGIQRKRLDKITVIIPDMEAQKKIASILYAADIEIRKQSQQLELLKIQKRGLMQKLLTGEWRVKIEETATQLTEVTE